MTQKKSSTKTQVPTLNGEELYIPFVGAIIEQVAADGKKQILIQVRDKVADDIYFGCIEVPGGKLKAYEDLYDAVRREVHEECGLRIHSIVGEKSRKDCFNKRDTSSIIEPFCITQMQNGPFLGVIFLCRASGEPIAAPGETRDVEWIDVEVLSHIVKHSPERIYTPFYAPLMKYLQIEH